MNITAIRHPALFVVGYPRSGTTLLASLLNRHSQIAIPPETQFFRAFMRDKRVEKIRCNNDLLKYYCNYPRIRDMNLKPADFEKFGNQFQTNKDNLLAASLDIYGRRQGKVIMGEKSPAHLLYWKEILHCYPESKIICLLRDGRDCIFSNIQQNWTHSDPVKHAAEWEEYGRCLKKLKSTRPDSLCVIKFEDLLQNPEKTLKHICAFIGCEYESRQLEEDKDNNLVPEWEKAWKAGAGSKPDASRTYAWKRQHNIKLVKDLSFIMKRSLSYFGYEAGDTPSISSKLKLYLTKGMYFFPFYPIAKNIKKHLFPKVRKT